jgi:hypothetical protein
VFLRAWPRVPVARALQPDVRVRAVLASLLLATACVSEPPPGPPLPDPLDTIWGKAIHPGDVLVIIPGTGSHDHLARAIDPLPGDNPVVDVHALPDVALYATPFEQAIGAAHRAGIANADLESGALPILVWGVGFQHATRFVYVSYEGLHVPMTVLGGQSMCATGGVLANLLNYTTSNAEIDSADLYMRLQAWLAAHPSQPRNVIVSAHSWGGAVSEWLAFHHGSDSLAPDTLRFTIAAGVPAFIPNYTFAGPGLRDLPPAGSLYEIDRPDDPVHQMNPSGNGNGHQYVILVGTDFKGAYGVTTNELACAGVPGPCSPNP